MGSNLSVNLCQAVFESSAIACDMFFATLNDLFVEMCSPRAE